MKTITLIYIIFLIGILSSCQTSKLNNKDNELKEFNAKTEQAKQYFLNGDFTKSEQAYREASEIAKGMKWTEGVIVAELEVAQVYSARKEHKKSELLLNELLEMCKTDGKCSADSLNTIYDSLSYLYLFDLKDETKLRKMIKDVALSKDKFGEDKTKYIICGYAEEIEKIRYHELASEINSSYSCSQSQ